jgi:LEA14-like dessication related protein
MKKIMILWGLAALLSSCDVAQQVVGTYNMTQCKYEYKSISGLMLAGVNLHDVSDMSSLNPLSLANLLGAFMSPEGNLPLNFTLNLDVTNPGLQPALLNGMAYILEVDGLEMTQGNLSQRIQVASGGKSVLPIQMSFDLKKVLSGKSMESVKNLAFNFAGIGNGASNVTVRLKPSFAIGTQTISVPNYIPVSFTLNK